MKEDLPDWLKDSLNDIPQPHHEEDADGIVLEEELPAWLMDSLNDTLQLHLEDDADGIVLEDELPAWLQESPTKRSHSTASNRSPQATNRAETDQDLPKWLREICDGPNPKEVKENRKKNLLSMIEKFTQETPEPSPPLENPLYYLQGLVTKLKQYARHLKGELYTLYLAAHHPKTPWYAKLLVASIVAYAVSPIDLIPDFVPVLGYLDDLILLPLGIMLAIKLVPQPVLTACRVRARESQWVEKPVSWVAGLIIIFIWVILVVFCIWVLFTC